MCKRKKKLILSLDMFKNIDKMGDLEGAQIAIRLLLNVIEDFQSQILSLKEENQQLRDENNRLKGEQGRPEEQRYQGSVFGYFI